MKQEKLAEKCGVSRQAVAKWEKGLSVPDINMLLLMANLFNVSLDKFVKGEEGQQYKKDVARKIYNLYVENLENLRMRLMYNAARYSHSDRTIAIKLRAEIIKSRTVFSKQFIDKLISMTEDFGAYVIEIICREQYKEIFEGIDNERERCLLYCENIVPHKYEEIEKLLDNYIEFV